MVSIYVSLRLCNIFRVYIGWATHWAPKVNFVERCEPAHCKYWCSQISITSIYTLPVRTCTRIFEFTICTNVVQIVRLDISWKCPITSRWPSKVYKQCGNASCSHLSALFLGHKDFTLVINLNRSWSVKQAAGWSISQEICTRFCCALFCCGYVIVHNEFTWSIYPYSSGLLCWHWGNR